MDWDVVSLDWHLASRKRRLVLGCEGADAAGVEVPDLILGCEGGDAAGVEVPDDTAERSDNVLEECQISQQLLRCCPLGFWHRLTLQSLQQPL